MRKKLTAIGNSFGIVIDRSILALLHMAPDAELEVYTDGKRLIIEPAVPPYPKGGKSRSGQQKRRERRRRD